MASTVERVPLRQPSLAKRRPRRSRAHITATPSSANVWDLESLPAVRDALERVRQSQNKWQSDILGLEDVKALERQRNLDDLRTERDRKDAVRKAADAERNARLAEEYRLRQEAEELARASAVAEEIARVAEQTERRRLQEEHQRAEEERIREEENIALIIALEEEERIATLELEAAAEAARIAEQEEGERIRRQVEAAAERARIAEEAEQRRRVAEAEERRRARLRDCAACREQHDVDTVVQVACRHWYCHESLRDAITSACAAGRPFQCCQQTVLANHVRGALPLQLFRQYSAIVEEGQEANPVYCSRPGCGAFLPARLASSPDESNCPQCGQSTCRHCKGRSHAGRECTADVTTQQARALAGRKGWKTCPRCRGIVEKSSGCMHMTCRCGARFCYRCGRLMSDCGDRCSG